MTQYKCPVCGTPVDPESGQGSSAKVYCSRACSDVAKRQRVKARRKPRQPVMCPACGQAVTVAMTGRSATYCSRECQSRALYLRKIADRVPLVLTCENCTAVVALPAIRPYQRFCSAECRLDFHRKPSVQRFSCRVCAAEFTRPRQKGNPPRTCPGCRAQDKWLKRTLYRKHAPEVYARDGWVCQICFELTDRDAKVPAHFAPTLDHIVPQSHGGSHDPSNLRTAHFICNARRSDQVAA